MTEKPASRCSGDADCEPGYGHARWCSASRCSGSPDPRSDETVVKFTA